MFAKYFQTQEILLGDYFIKPTRICYMLSYIKTGKSADEYAIKTNVKFPTIWNSEKMTEFDGITGSTRRHSIFSLRKPENNRIAWTMALNKPNVEEYSKNIRVCDKSTKILKTIIIRKKSKTKTCTSTSYLGKLIFFYLFLNIYKLFYVV